VALTAFVQHKLRSTPGYWDEHRAASLVLAAISLLVWVAILSAGRWIGYVEHG
jgi:hypothetical protein